MQYLKRCLFAGLPIMATLCVLVWAFTIVDGVLAGPQKLLFKFLFNREFSIPGLGILVLLLATLLIGFLILNFLTKWLMRTTGHFFKRAPLVKMLYGSIKDLFNAFVGDNQHFNKPVLVKIMADSPLLVAGFVTNEDLAVLGHADKVAVYFPQSYNFAGNLVLVPKSTVTPIDATSGEIMKFILSGGVSKIKMGPAPEEKSIATGQTA